VSWLRSRKTVLVILLIGSFVGLTPISVRIANPLFTHPFRPDWPYSILLVWPDHVEVRFVHRLSEVSPRPPDAGYTFNVSPERQTWVEEQVRRTRPRNPDASFGIIVKQLGPDRQLIQLESWRDGFTGLIYEARPDAIVPLKTRHAGPLDSMTILSVHSLVWGGLWFLAWTIYRIMMKHRPSQTSTFAS